VELPLVIDSLRTSELTEKNAKGILNVINEELPDHQLIIASVYKYDGFDFSETEIFERLINQKD
jgi:hypothetical protein